MRSLLDLNSYDITLFARKNANKALFLLACSVSGLAYGQENDTIKITTDESYTADIEHFFQLPVTIAQQPIKDFTHTEVYYKFNKNEFARKQTASETSRYGFKAQGLFETQKNVKLFGTIDLQKYTEKNIAYTLDDKRTDEIEVLPPLYYFVPRASDWNNQQYHISAGAVKRFGNFNLASKASLDADKYARQVDPRPEISNRKLGGEVQVGYTFNQHQLFTLAAYHRKDKDYNYYYNNKYLDNIGYPETYIRFQSGFGLITNKPYNSSKLFTKTRINKYGGGYQYLSGNTSFVAEYAYQRSLENFYNRNFEEKRLKRFQYQTITNQGSLRLRQKIDDKLLRASLSGSIATSKNFDMNAMGTNYMNRLRNITFDINLTDQKNTLTNYYIGGFIKYNQNRYMDQLVFIDQKVNSLVFGVYGNKDFELKNQSKFNIGLNVNYYTALKNYLGYLNLTGTSTNNFYDEIIMYDNLYNGMNKLDTKADIRYILPVNNNKNVTFYSQFRGIFALDKNKNELINFSTNPSYQINLGIQLNY